MAPTIYNKHPNKDCLQAIRSLQPADGMPSRGGATPVPTRDETTWLDGGLRCHRSRAERPHSEEEARVVLCAEHGVAILVASSRGGRTLPPGMKHRPEPKLQGLPERATASPRRPKRALGHLLAVKVGQVDRSFRSAAGEAVTALEEEVGAACVQACQIPFPLAIEAGR
jgi:hypothetical protein